MLVDREWPGMMKEGGGKDNEKNSRLRYYNECNTMQRNATQSRYGAGFKGVAGCRKARRQTCPCLQGVLIRNNYW